MKKTAPRVSPNPWGDPQAAISVTCSPGKPAPEARSGPAAPSSPGPVRQHVVMASKK